ncbi:PREDICTED: mannose-1-phosphate guanyltransferase alpha-B-like [Acropora digitifera]|uniref:mannose-1-phosphate guanyltransferase alpha-B-like n=1 Tax=Acropora digitifera TaxID=70779 RepID=UPI00077A1F57|nr:PREDICTED: mannose-1-phosphate guanyltransferase alpha-B-like [Acropora digitifera]
MIKVVILIGGPMKGTRFRPLSLELPKPLFPIGGFPVVYHHIEACVKIPELKEIILIGFYQSSDSLSKFISSAQQEFNIPIRYLQEFQPLGTAGGLYHFRDQISMGDPDSFVVLNADMMGDYPLREFVEFHMQHIGEHSVLATEANKRQAHKFGCLVEDPSNHKVGANCANYTTDWIHECHFLYFSFFFSLAINFSEEPFSTSVETVRMGEDVLPSLASSGTLYSFKTRSYWTLLKSAGSAIYANRNVLSSYHKTHPDLLAQNGVNKPHIIGDVYIHPSATVHASAVLGPNVSVGSNVNIGAGARVRETILLDGAELKDHCCILYSIIGWNCSIGVWSRVEGSRCDPNPNEEFAKPDGESLFGNDGKLTPSITVLGRNVTIPGEVIVLNSIVLPHKDLSQSYKNEIIL